jgi:hypothetical protein
MSYTYENLYKEKSQSTPTNALICYRFSRFSRLVGSEMEFLVSGIWGWNYFVLFCRGARDSVVVVVTRLAGRLWKLRNHGSFPGIGNIFLYSSTGLDRLKVPFIQLVLEVLLPGLGRMKLITHLHIVPRLRLNGAVSPFYHMSKWHAQRFCSRKISNRDL